MDQLMAKVEEPTALTNPPEIVMDRIHFVVNNVTANNLPQKVEVLYEFLQYCAVFVFQFPSTMNVSDMSHAYDGFTRCTRGGRC